MFVWAFRCRLRGLTQRYGGAFLALLAFVNLVAGIALLTAYFFHIPPGPDFAALSTALPSPAADLRQSVAYEDGVLAPRAAALVGDIYSARALLTELSSGRVLYRKAPEERSAPASLTKMMTIILALEALPDLDEEILLPEAIFPPLHTAGASMAGFQPGERVPVRDLLYGAMLPSGAEAAVGLACAVSGSESDFVQRMNEKAGELGMTETRFANCTGLNHPGQWSTARDMTVLLQYALQNEMFRELFTRPTYRTPSNEYHPSGISMVNTMFSQVRTARIEEVGYLLGGKTGYDGPVSGLCLASLAEVGGEEYILITLGAGHGETSPALHLLDAFTIYSRIPEMLSM